MGLGTDRSEWDDYEWFDLADVEEPRDADDAAGLVAAVRDAPLWLPGPAVRVLLVDLDNLRVEPVKLRGRVGLTVALARQADVAAFAGQGPSVQRALPSLAEFAVDAIAVGSDHNEADAALLAAAADVEADDVQFLVVSNDGIFARLAMRGPLTVLSPGPDSLSERLVDAAERVVDLQAIESLAVS